MGCMILMNEKIKKTIDVTCISDLHGHYPKLEGGDLLIIAGDLTARDEPHEYIYFRNWLSLQDYRKKIVIAGNHDNNLELDYRFGSKPFLEIADYLCDSGTEFEGLKIWGSPHTKTFPGMNPKCKAFTCDTEEELNEKWKLIPDDVDILITHSPAYGVLDQNIKGEHCGSKSLLEAIQRIKPRLIVHGHLHEQGSICNAINGTTFVNASHVNEKYQPVNKPVRIEI